MRIPVGEKLVRMIAVSAVCYGAKRWVLPVVTDASIRFAARVAMRRAMSKLAYQQNEEVLPGTDNAGEESKERLGIDDARITLRVNPEALRAAGKNPSIAAVVNVLRTSSLKVDSQTVDTLRQNIRWPLRTQTSRNRSLPT
jgi:hypothetical protein